MLRLTEKCLLIVLICAVFSGCAGETDAGKRRENAFTKSKTKETTHSNGLRLNAPENLMVYQTADGFAVAPSSSRGMSEVEVSIGETSGESSSESLSKQKKIGRRVVDYKIEKQASSGSGGDEYTITAVEKTQNRTVRYEQSDQAETGEPSFEFFWSMVVATTL